jgi:predicted unusual protein kinase regulating ubiquinone biosynthesis (AarF/ABC1/UbiB family)
MLSKQPPEPVRYDAPRPIALPSPGARFRARRFARTAGSFGRHVSGAVAGRVAGNAGSPAQGIRRAFEDLGATYIKFGQMIASAPAIIPAAIADEFRTTLDSGPPIPFEQVQRIVLRELGGSIAEQFCTFEQEPFAAASIAVVHRATLHDGQHVAVKIVRPGVARTVAADLDLMEPVFRALARQGSNPAYNALAYLIGLRAQVAEELDLRNEVRTMAYFRVLFETFGLSKLVIPRVIESHSTRRVLTMEYLDGVPIDDLAAAAELGVEPRPLVNELLRAWVLSALRAGVFHADIHAGNLMILRDGRLAMLDWGIVARLNPETRAFFRGLVEAAIGREEAWGPITDHVIATQGTVLDAFGYTHEDMVVITRQYLEPVLTRPLKDVSMAAMFMPPERAAELNHGIAVPKRSRKERWFANRATARAFRNSLDEGLQENSTQRANFLSAKQLLYLEKYGRIYMPDEALLGDHAFLATALEMDNVDG